jgi:hypothetical protein
MMTPEQLLNILSQVPPHEPAAVKLLRERRAELGELFPAPNVSRIQIVRATMEMKRISDQSQALARELMTLQSVPLTDPRAEDVIGGYCL